MTAKGISNDLVLLDAVVKELQSSGPAGLRDDEFFEFFTFDQILKSHDLSDDELLDGQLGGGDEGGLDGLFAFADDRLLDENSDFSRARRGVELSIYVIQSKREGSFSETLTFISRMYGARRHLIVLLA